MATNAPLVPRQRASWLRILLIIPFIATLWVPFFNHPTPTLFGFPFFYWYQLLWVPLSSVLIFIVYRAES
ncbi:MAG TPA: DUF3311 domain-containing protein [Acetobacteraceae bacterium]|nr:DUF3311 domain-containing protein [Acetobacteraceae bacterium]